MQRILTLTVFVFLAFGGSVSRAQTTAVWDDFAGKWEPGANSSEAVKAGVDRSLKPVNAAARAIARWQLLAKLAPTWIRMERQNQLFIIEFADKPPRSMPISGAEILHDGQRFSLQLTDGTLRQTAVRSDGTRVNRFRVGKAGSTLTMETTITSPRLTIPVQFTIEFSRAKKP